MSNDKNDIWHNTVWRLTEDGLKEVKVLLMQQFNTTIEQVIAFIKGFTIICNKCKNLIPVPAWLEQLDNIELQKIEAYIQLIYQKRKEGK